MMIQAKAITEMSAVMCSKILSDEVEVASLDWDWDVWLFHIVSSNSVDIIFCIVIVGVEKGNEILSIIIVAKYFNLIYIR
jgi:hypothetical protein